MSTERNIRESYIRERFVPQVGISEQVLQDNLAVYFGPGAKIDRKLQVDGQAGWLIAGGRVSDAIINTLRKMTQNRGEDPGRTQRIPVPTMPSNRHAAKTTTDQGRLLSNVGRSISSPVSRHVSQPALEQSPKPSDFDSLQRPADRHTVTTAKPSGLYLPTRSSIFLPPDQTEPYSPANQDRYPPTDVVDFAPRETRHTEATTSVGRKSQSSLTARHGKSSTSNTDPDYAAEHPETTFTLEDFDDWKDFKRYLQLKQMREQQPLSQNTSESRDRSRRHQDQGRYIEDSPSTQHPEDAAGRPRGLASLRASRGRDDDEDEDPDYGQNRIPQSNRQGQERGSDTGRQMRNLGRDEDDEDPDAIPDYGLSTPTNNPDRARQHQDRPTSGRDSKPSSRKSGNKDKEKGRGSYR